VRKAKRLREQRAKENAAKGKNPETAMAASLEGPNLKLKWAEEHLNYLGSVIQAFYETNPYEISVEDNPEAGQREHRVVRAEPIPPQFALIAGDCIHNMRSALDHLIWQLVLANGNQPEDLRTEFPIWKSKAAFEAGRPGKAKGVSEEALDILYGLQPYQGGSDALWRLHRLDIVDKHRLIITLAAGYQNFILDMSPGEDMLRELAKAPSITPKEIEEMKGSGPALAINPAERFRIEKGTVLFGSPLGEERYDETKFSVDVALFEPEVPEGESLVKTLQELFRFVTETIALFESLID
jgi:hypothetical protein